MKKIITINGIACTFKSSAAVPRIYRLKYGRDIFVDLNSLKKNVKNQDPAKSTLPIHSLEMFENVAYVMHKHGDPTQPDTIDEWLEQFETFDIYTVLPEILELWKLENQQTSVPKKEAGK